MDDIENTEFAKKGKEIAGDIGKKAYHVVETVSHTGEKIGQSPVFKSVSQVFILYTHLHTIIIYITHICGVELHHCLYPGMS